MFQQLARVLAAEIALHKHNKVNRQGIVSPHAQRFFVLKNILPKGVFRGLQNAASHLKARSVREDSNWRKGQALGKRKAERRVKTVHSCISASTSHVMEGHIAEVIAPEPPTLAQLSLLRLALIEC